MRFYLDNDKPLSDHDVASSVLRYDLVPIPVTLEMTVNASPLALAHLGVGRTVYLADGTAFTIVKSQSYMGSKILDGNRTGAIAVTAVLSGCEALIHATPKAINIKDASFAEIYRACGAKVRFGSDMKVNDFVCFKGQMATTRIAWALQKEAACVFYDITDHTVKVKRINELMTQAPTIYDPTAVVWQSHAHAFGDIAPHHLSIDKDGTQIIGTSPDKGRMDYMPRCDHRELVNLSCVLMMRGTIQRAVDERLLASKLVSVSDKNYLVATSAICYQSGAFGGHSDLSIKAWLYSLEDS